MRSLSPQPHNQPQQNPMQPQNCFLLNALCASVKWRKNGWAMLGLLACKRPTSVAGERRGCSQLAPWLTLSSGDKCSLTSCCAVSCKSVDAPLLAPPSCVQSHGEGPEAVIFCLELWDWNRFSFVEECCRWIIQQTFFVLKDWKMKYCERLVHSVPEVRKS